MDDYLKNVAVIGASGKMGRGIALLLMQLMMLESEKYKKSCFLKLIDQDELSLMGLKRYLHSQILRFAEKNIIELREIYKDRDDLINNEEIIIYFVSKAFDFTSFSISLEETKTSNLVFEAIVEDFTTKVNLYKRLLEICPKETYFFTNTSSIPIHALSEASGLKDRLIGFHFYNPPAIQKLLEIIPSKYTSTILNSIALNLAQKFNKTVVYSGDITGFIGNGHFIPEVLFACKKVRELANTQSLNTAIFNVNYVTKEFLIRPMGIFQLVDYVGIDVVQKILATMKYFSKNATFQEPLIDKMIQKNIFGGQKPNGEQKDGFFSYEGSEIIGYFDLEKDDYRPFPKIEDFLGPLPTHHNLWKALKNNKDQKMLLEKYLDSLLTMNTFGAELAEEFLIHSYQVATNLVNQNVAKSLGDVTTVLKEGFYHLYGPDFITLKRLANI